MQITKYIHTTYEIKTNGNRILIDPGIFSFKEDINPAEYFSSVSLLLLSHLHADHFDLETIEKICKRAKPEILSQRDVAAKLAERGIESKILNPRETHKIGSLSITATRTAHKQDAIGFLINDGKRSLYYSSDTFYLEDKPYADIVIIPIGNRGVVMSPTEAAQFVKEIHPKIAIPSHYETPKDNIKPQDFEEIMRGSDIKTAILGYRESTEL